MYYRAVLQNSSIRWGSVAKHSPIRTCSVQVFHQRKLGRYLCGQQHKSAFGTVSSASIEVKEVSYHDKRISSSDEISFGRYASISSLNEVCRPYTDIKTLGLPSSSISEDDSVWIRGRVAAVRQKGKSCFLVIRSDSFYTVQACHFLDSTDPNSSKNFLAFIGSINLESIVDIQGTLAPARVKSCTQDNVEIQMKKMFVVSSAPNVLPFLLQDAARPDRGVEDSQNQASSMNPVSQVHKLSLFYIR